MGIHNIHILSETVEPYNRILQAQAALQEKLIQQHRQGMHPWGSMRRECPLCQANK